MIGVCAMRKKAKSKPMNELLDRITAFTSAGISEFRVVFFDEDMILNEPVTEWPLCEALIAFFSTGFPLQKAAAYAELRRPLVFNDLSRQEMLFDRRMVYQILEESGVPVPKYTVLDPSRDNVVDEQEDYLEVNGCRIQKPLVEKPASGEDHNIYIYYPRALGGGSKRLFRKVGDRSSQFYPQEHTTRVHDGNAYIYEELLQTEGTDVKVYTVGPEYAHAEARKSPVVDGKVMRNPNGREVRYPVLLTAAEKEISRKVVLGFGQSICGFDLLRSNGASYVCDVNGWSFVKDSQKFWDDSANLIRKLTLEAVAPSHYERFPLGNNPMLQGLPGSEEDEELSRPEYINDEGAPPPLARGPSRAAPRAQPLARSARAARACVGCVHGRSCAPMAVSAAAAWRRRAAVRRGGGAAWRPHAQAEAQVHDDGADAALAVHRVPARGRG